MTDETEKKSERHKSLLSKYEIPIDHLSYEYIQGCNDIRELERIVKILKSGEEGYFPDLLRSTEDRLRVFSPNNRHLRTETPALDRSYFDKNEWRSIMDEVDTWRKDVTEKDKQLCCKITRDVSEISMPPIRQQTQTQSIRVSENQPKQIKKVNDYSLWDKYDVDTELLKMDIEEEKKYFIAIKKPTQKEPDRLNLIEEEAQIYSNAEKEILAEHENLRGNEFYQAKDYEEAEKYYTASLAIHPTAKTFNNRASCRLKLAKYSEAIEDADKTLELEANNIKALYRKGIALKHLNKYQEALQIMKCILNLDPNVSQAQTVANQLSEKIRLETKDIVGLQKSNLVERQKCVDKHSPECFNNPSFKEPVNEWGLPKMFCNSSGCCNKNNSKCKNYLGVHERANAFGECSSSYENIFEKQQSSLFSKHTIQSFKEEKKKNDAVKIVELPEESVPKVPKRMTKMEIIEMDSSQNDPHEDVIHSQPMKCRVVDKRSQKSIFKNQTSDK
ncbi:sperm-associated antigen 1-like [Macrosteles quadrilineatus]|uniref:sperm-associated antigen 1-like n=1 Tax=Macrosteles quadrilineatus TaxID=74068 RepID=UPI0023E0A918|nr:sperm-associated antigen 1-like [Macrosteles quadrilineatus]